MPREITQCYLVGYTFSMSPLSSFFRFLLGFLVFISISFGVTIAVNEYSISQDQAQQTAAALQAMLQQK